MVLANKLNRVHSHVVDFKQTQKQLCYQSLKVSNVAMNTSSSANLSLFSSNSASPHYSATSRLGPLKCKIASSGGMHFEETMNKAYQEMIEDKIF